MKSGQKLTKRIKSYLIESLRVNLSKKKFVELNSIFDYFDNLSYDVSSCYEDGYEPISISSLSVIFKNNYIFSFDGDAHNLLNVIITKDSCPTNLVQNKNVVGDYASENVYFRTSFGLKDLELKDLMLLPCVFTNELFSLDDTIPEVYNKMFKFSDLDMDSITKNNRNISLEIGNNLYEEIQNDIFEKKCSKLSKQKQNEFNDLFDHKQFSYFSVNADGNVINEHMYITTDDDFNFMTDHLKRDIKKLKPTDGDFVSPINTQLKELYPDIISLTARDIINVMINPITQTGTKISCL